jgi:hypothetical protein
MYGHNTYLTSVFCDLQLCLLVFYVKTYVVFSKYIDSYLVLWFMSLNLNTRFILKKCNITFFLLKLRDVIYI